MTQKTNYSELTSSRKLAANTIINVVAKVIPLAVGVIAIPVLIEKLGTEIFGLLAIIWLVINYLSVFDLGMSPSIVRSLSERLGRNHTDDIPGLLWTGLLFLAFTGVLLGVALYMISPWLVTEVFQIAESNYQAAITSLRYTAFAIPFIISATGFRAILESLQKFAVISTVQAFNSLFNYLIPLMVVIVYTSDLSVIILSLLFVKIMIFAVYLVSAFRAEKTFFSPFVINKAVFKELIGFGKWVTLSNLISSVMTQIDRYFIGAVISLSAVTFYTTPLEVLSKVMIIPMAFISVFFPAFSTLSGKNKKRREQLFLDSQKSVSVLIFPVFFTISLFAGKGLQIWLGNEFVLKSTLIAQIFCLVYMIRGFAYIPSAYIKGINRPDLLTIFHVSECIVLLGILYYLSLGNPEPIHVAYAILSVTVLDTVLIIGACYILIDLKSDFRKEIMLPMVILTFLLLSIFFLSDGLQKWIVFAGGLGIYLVTFRKHLKKLYQKTMASRVV